MRSAALAVSDERRRDRLSILGHGGSSVPVLKALVAILSCTGCVEAPRAEAAAVAPGIDAREVASVRLTNRPGMAVSKPLAIALDARGYLYVADAFHDAVLVFSPDGRLQHVAQHRDDGRTEPFKIGGFIGITDGDALIFDYSGHRVALATTDSSAPRIVGHYRGRLSGGRIDSSGMWFGMVDLDRGFTVAHRIAPLAGDTLMADRLPVPSEYASSAMLSAVYDWMRLVRVRDTLLVAFAGLNDLVVADTTGRVLGRIPIPAGSRRGVPRSLTDRMAKGEAPFAESISGMSGLFAMDDWTGGRIGLVHIDQTVEQRLYKAEALWLTIVDAGFRRACIDIGIPVRDGSTPAVAVRGDTVVTVQVSLDDAGTSIAEMRKFVADLAGCSWTDLR